MRLIGQISAEHLRITIPSLLRAMKIAYHSPLSRRRALISPLCRLPSIRRRLAAFDGLVFRRFFGSCIA